MDDLSKHYQLLGLKPDASPEEMKQAYRDMVKVWHPDRFGHDARLRLKAQNKLKEINGAYELLKARAFQASIAPEPDAPKTEPATGTPPAARNRTALWATFGILAFASIAAAGFLFFEKGHGKQAATTSETNAAVAVNIPSPTNADCSLRFDGHHGHLSIASTGSLTGTFTVECWVLDHKPNLGGTILSSRITNDFGMDIKFRQAKRFHADIGDGSKWLVKNANATYAYQGDTWYHLAYVVTTNSYSIYVNSKLEDKAAIFPAGNPMLYDASHGLCIGMDNRDADDLDGNIAELRIWQTARTQNQIESNMNRTLSGNQPGLMGYWRFAEGSGTVTADSSGHGFTGALTNGASWSKNVPLSFQH